MRIGIVGAGNIGGTLAAQFVRAGHEVAVSNSRGPETLRGFVDELGERARAVTPAEAIAFGEIVVVSIPLGRIDELPTEGAEGKVVIDTNNYYPNRDGSIEALDADQTTSSELLQARMKGARVVKAFNAIYWVRLRDLAQPAGGGERYGIPISGDDAEAKRIVAELIDQIGFEAVDAGTLAEGGRRHQPGMPVYTTDLRASELRAKLQESDQAT